MIEFYPQIRLAHLLAIVASMAIFLLRLLLSRRPAGCPGWTSVLALTVDATALSAALILFTVLPSAMFANGWLKMKLIGVAMYLAGSRVSLAERFAPRQRFALGAVTIAVFLVTVSIARAHHPWGYLGVSLGTVVSAESP